MFQNSTLSDPFFDKLQQLPSPVGGGKIIPRQENSEFFEAQSLVEQAQKRANNLFAEIERATVEGHNVGLKQGLADADIEVAKKLNAYEQQIAAFYDNAEETILDVSFGVIRRFLGAYFKPDDVRKFITREISERQSSQPYALHVSADMETLTYDAIRELVQLNPTASVPAVQIDPRLGSGRAVLITRFGSVDLDLESQLNALRESLSGNAPMPRQTWGAEAAIR